MAVSVATKKAVIERDGSTLSNRYSIEWRQPRRVRKHSSRGLTQQIGTSDWRADMDSIRECSVEGCDRPFKAKDFCSRHWEWNHKYGKPEKPEMPVKIDVCVVDDCSRADIQGRGMCKKHYIRWYRTGETAVTRPQRSCRGVCSSPGCAKADCGPHGLCAMHKTRLDRHGDTAIKLKPPARRGAENSQWTGDEASYSAIHLRLRVRRGPAKLQTCVRCGDAAAQWSYDRTDADERQSAEGPYSTDLSHYQALCVPCHKVFDLGAIRAHL